MMKNWIPVGIYPAKGGTGMTFCGFSEATTFGGGRSRAEANNPLPVNLFCAVLYSCGNFK